VPLRWFAAAFFIAALLRFYFSENTEEITMKTFIKVAKAFWNDEKGLEVVEYIVIGTFVVIATVLAYTTLGQHAAGKVNAIASQLAG
jgi:Flp pilus assembly pilin Flp